MKSKNLSERVKAGRFGVQFAYVLDSIKDCSRATDEGLKFETDFDCISFFFDCFESEFNYEYNRRLFPNLVDRIAFRLVQIAEKTGRKLPR